MPEMPTLARLYLRTAILFLCLGVLTGLHMSSALNLGEGGFHYPYRIAHTHLLLIGFVLMSLMGAALWLLPAPRPRSFHQGWIPPLVYAVLSLSTIGRYTLEVWLGYFETEACRRAIFVVSCFQTAAILGFFLNLLPRIRGA